MFSRIQLFEWEDLPHFPVFLRNALTSYLSLVWTVGGFYKKTLPILQKALNILPQPHITDLCSGAGGAIPRLYTELKKKHPNIQITLSDQYPNLERLRLVQQQSHGAITFRETPTDARTIMTQPETLCTMFLALHHFSPQDAQKIFQNSMNHGVPIAIFEIQQRSIFDVLLMLIHIPLSMLVLPLTKPCWKQIICTYIIPIIPFCITWDGIISTLRTYSQQELRELVQACDDPGYQWQYGKVCHPLHSVTYFLGLPPRTTNPKTIDSMRT